MLALAERARKDALAQAEKPQGWTERERLRQAAEKAYEGSRSRIDELADSFAEIEGTGRSTQVFDEMTRILAEQGVDQALAYVATKSSGILEKVKTRAAAVKASAAAASEKNRSDLLPLVKRAQLEAERNHPGEAEHLFREILALEPDWSEPRNALARFLIQRGEVIEPASLWDLGTRSGGEEGRKRLTEAIAAYRSALEVYTKADVPQDWAATQNNLGNALRDLGTRSGGQEGRKLLAEAPRPSEALWKSGPKPICRRIGL